MIESKKERHGVPLWAWIIAIVSIGGILAIPIWMFLAASTTAFDLP